MKKILLFFIGILWMQILCSAPVLNLKRVVTQPDGSILTLFLSGDEYANRMHDAGNYSVIIGKDGYYYYAVNDAEGNVIASEYRYGKVDPQKVGIPQGVNISPEIYRKRLGNARLTRSVLTTAVAGRAKSSFGIGTMNNIVVLISFADDEEFDTPRKDIELKFNGEDRESLKDYYQEVSYGKLTLQSSFFPVCASETNLSYKDIYPRSTFEGPGGTVEKELLKRAIDALKPEIEAAFTADELDHDGDGKVDNLFFVIRGKTGNWGSLLWPHQGILNMSDNQVLLHGKQAYKYVMIPEESLEVRTMCHEMFHVFDAPDLYSYSELIQKYVKVGDWDIMEYGNGHMCSYLKWRYANGWIAGIPEITESGRYSLKALGSGDKNVCYKIKVGPAGQEEQFLLLEFRRKAGRYESKIPESGLLVYRIMPNRDGNGSAPWGVYVYRPGGTDKINGDQTLAAFSKESGRTRISADTDPALFLAANNDGSASGYSYVEISDVSEAKSDEIFFTVTLPAEQEIFRVKPGGKGDGSSWEQAMGNLQRAVDLCNAQGYGEIWLAEGTYQFPGDTIRLKEYTQLYGGFAGTEQSREERKMTDRNGNGIVEPWEYQAVSVFDFSGGGILETVTTLEHRPVLFNGVTISGLKGSLVLPWGAFFSGLEICRNTLPDAGAEEGLIKIETRQTGAILEGSYIHHNEGAGALVYQKSGEIRGCVFANNRSTQSSLFCLKDGTFQTCLVVNNETENYPGISIDEEVPVLRNNTIAHNKTQNASGWFMAVAGKLRMYNTILWENNDSGIPELLPDRMFELYNCAIQGFQNEGFSGNFSDNYALETDNEGNIAGKYYVDFVRPSTERGVQTDGFTGADWRCNTASVCIDKGYWGYWPRGTDVAGNVRIMNGTVDIGAYEQIKKIAASVTFEQLQQEYTGEPLKGKVLTDPEGLAVAVTYDGAEQLPVEAGTYQIKAVITAPSYEGEATGNFVILPVAQTLKFPAPYVAALSEGQKVLHAESSSGLPVVFSSSDPTVVEIREDSVAIFKQTGEVTLTITQPGNTNYKYAAITQHFVVKTNAAKLTLTGLTTTYNGQTCPVAVTTEPEGLACRVTYNGMQGVPVNAGKYVVEAVVTEAGYAGYAVDTLNIGPARVQIEFTNRTVEYNGNEQWPSVETVPAGIPCKLSADGLLFAPCSAGKYQVTATVDDPNYKGETRTEFVIERAEAQVALVQDTMVYTAAYLPVQVITQPADRFVDNISYVFEADGRTEQPYYAGKYKVRIQVDEVNYYADKTFELVVEKAMVDVQLDRTSLQRTYNGQAVEVGAVITAPIDGLDCKVLYNGVENKPVDAGEYKVTAEVTDKWRYQGYDTVILHIEQASQQVTFEQQTQLGLDVSSVLLEASASSGLDVVYESSVPAVASVENGRLVLHRAGTTVVTAHQAGNKNYKAAEPVSLTFILKKSLQQIVWEQQLETLSLGTEPVELTAEASSGLLIEYVSGNEDIAAVQNGMLVVKGVGQVMITARQNGNDFYEAATPVTKTVKVVVPAEQVEAVDLIIAGGTHEQKFQIKNVSFMPDNHLIVMSKAGEVVYERDNYDNSYDMGQVPAGTYYYVFTWKNNQGVKQTKKGFVEVVRN